MNFLIYTILIQIIFLNLQIQNCMQILQNKKIVKVIETNKGDVLSPTSNPEKYVKIVIFNEHLSPQCSQVKCNTSLDLEHLNYHKQNPYSLENTSISWASIQHEIRQVFKRTNLTQDDVLIFDSSEYTQKIPQIFNRFQIVKGYNYRLKIESFGSISQEKLTLLKQQHVSKQIQMQFSLGNGLFKPGYIGQISLQEISNPYFEGIIKAYLDYSAKTQCPIVINFVNADEEPYHFLFSENSKQIEEIMQKKLTILQNLLRISQQKNCCKNIVIYNLPIILSYQSSTFQVINLFQKQIQQIVAQYYVKIGFSLLRYSKSHEKQGLNQIIKLLQKYPQSVILSSGLKFKTDLTLNAGQGLSLYADYLENSSQIKDIAQMNAIEYLKQFVQTKNLDRAIRRNILELFDWKQKKQEIIVQIFWKCDTCQNDFSQKLKAFGKFGKQFCSIKCMKAFKF